jgi:hypothetical protein
MPSHDAIRHPFTTLEQSSDRFLTWVADKALASPVMFYIALITPLLVLPMSESIKAILMIVSSNWIQWWALPALQRRQNELDAKANAKADADHEAMTHLASTQDVHTEILQNINRNVTMLVHPSNPKADNV